MWKIKGKVLLCRKDKIECEKHVLVDSVIEQTLNLCPLISLGGSPQDLQFAGYFKLSMHDGRRFAEVIHFLKSN